MSSYFWWKFLAAGLCPLDLWSSLRKKRRSLLRLRWRLKDSVSPSYFWVHTLSVGEFRAAKVLLKGLKERFPEASRVLTLSTTAGYVLAQKEASDLAHVLPSPLHCPGSLKSYFKVLRPRLFILVETDLWPDLLWGLRGQGVPALLVNGALSEKSFRRLKRCPPLVRLLYGPFSVLVMASEADARRLRALNPGPPVLTLGNLKYDFPPPKAEEIKPLKEVLFFLKPPVIVAGSTHPGEENLILEAWKRLKEGSLVLCPRHPQRALEILKEVQRQGLKATLRSKPSQAPIVIVDTLGELRALYGLADAALVGGTLVPVGGHNLLEPAGLGVPVVFGPYVESVSSIAEELKQSGGGLEVAPHPEALARGLKEALKEKKLRGRQAQAVFKRHQGALQKYLNLIERALKKLSTEV